MLVFVVVGVVVDGQQHKGNSQVRVVNGVVIGLLQDWSFLRDRLRNTHFLNGLLLKYDDRKWTGAKAGSNTEAGLASDGRPAAVYSRHSNSDSGYYNEHYSG